MSERRDYHDYVFKDGKLVGEFEEMYKHSADVPWHQDEVKAFPDIPVSKALLRIHAPYASLLEVGSGLGYYLNEISDIVSNKRQLIGIDVSPTAVQKSRELFPELRFEVCDVASERFTSPIKEGASMVVVRGFFWYVFPRMSLVAANIKRGVAPNGYLFVHQNFPPLSSSFVGKEVIPNPDALIGFFKGDFDLLVRNDFDFRERATNDYWTSILMRKKAL
jgi:SAM-dependent methyltransferase